MANPDNPFGLRPIRRAGASYVTGGGNLYHVAASDAQVIAPGDPVVVVASGSDAFGIPTVTRASVTAGSRITGVMLGIANGEAQLDGTGGINFDSSLNTVASTDQYILVEDDPQVTYAIQASGALVADDISETALLVAGVAEQGKSTFEVATPAANLATSQVRILRLQRTPNNELDTNGIVEVMINLPTNVHDTAGV